MPKPRQHKRITLMRRLIALLKLLIEKKRGRKSRQALLYEQARLTLGKDASPRDIVSDDLGCAESVSQLIRKVVPFSIITGTWTLNDTLKKDTRFLRATEHAGPGTIIISPTGTGDGQIRGHVGILGPNQSIMSNDSAMGIWRQNYTVEKWRKRWQEDHQFPVYFYRLK